MIAPSLARVRETLRIHVTAGYRLAIWRDRVTNATTYYFADLDVYAFDAEAFGEAVTAAIFEAGGEPVDGAAALLERHLGYGLPIMLDIDHAVCMIETKQYALTRAGQTVMITDTLDGILYGLEARDLISTFEPPKRRDA